MELINTNSENSFDQTPKLKSSPVPILFISFNYDENKCSYCGNEYSETLLFKQKYCKNCLFWYIKYTTDNNTYLDVHISTNNTRCIEHEATRNTDFYTRNIREWCEHCSDISYFSQTITSTFIGTTELIKSGTHCKLCGKLIYQQSSLDSYYVQFKLCPDCYPISFGWVESIVAKKPILILYLPHWDSTPYCISCEQSLSFVSDCRKWCSDCYLIYTGCRYCLTTNIIFGPINQSQCRKCKRISIINIDITNISSGDHSVDEILNYINFDIQIDQIANDVNNFNSPLNLYNFYILVKPILKNPKMKWIPYSQIKNLTEIAKGGFGIIYKATLLGTLDGPVALKKFFNSQNMSKCFLNELKSLYQCYDPFIIRYIGISQDPKTKEYMLIMNYANKGDLHNYLKNDFANITWKGKLDILQRVSMGLGSIHIKHYIHRDFHSGNILSMGGNRWYIGDLGLSQPANNISNNEIYGVIPYIAPEIFKGAAFSQESDIYSMGMIMWELTTGCKPFANVEHDTDLIYEIIDGKQPEITGDTPECYANLMKRCWDSDPLKRPSISEIKNTIYNWWTIYHVSCDQYEYFDLHDTVKRFEQAEKRRIELIQSKKLGPEFSEKPHPKAIFTSRALSSLISKSSYSTSIITFNSTRQEYISKEYDLDINIDIQRSDSPNINFTVQNSLNAWHSNTVYTSSRPLSKLISTVNSSRKRDADEEIIQNDRKHVKTDNLNSDPTIKLSIFYI